MRVRPLNEDKLQLLVAESEGEGTRNQNRWSQNRFKAWSACHGEIAPEDGIASEFKDVPLDNISFVLTKLSTEITDIKGEPYQAKTFHNLLLALCRVSIQIHGEPGNFMGKLKEFSYLNKIINGRMKQLQGIRRTKKRKKSAIVTEEQEEALWESNAFDITDPRGLLRAVVFVLTKTFILKGGQELAQISMADISMSTLEDGMVLLTYTEHLSKNHQPGIQAVNRDQKIVDHECECSDERDVYFILNEYLKHCSEEARSATNEKPTRLLTHVKPYLTKEKAKSTTVWYSARPVGRHYFRQLFKESFAMSNIPVEELKVLLETLSLRVLRGTTITKLRASGQFTDAEIRTRTGHISDGSLNAYEKPAGKHLRSRLSAAIRGIIFFIHLSDQYHIFRPKKHNILVKLRML